MKFSKGGYPAPNGAYTVKKDASGNDISVDDFEDSSHLAGILAIMEHPEAVDCRKYVNDRYLLLFGGPRIYMRCPDSKYDFSRDQFILLAAGFIKQNQGFLVNLDYITGRDIIPPSVRGMVRIAQGKKPLFYQNIWLKAEIYWSAYVQPLDEPFQIIALCMTYGDEYLKLWTSKNTLWQWSIKRYLSELDGAWRNENDLAEFVIEKINQKVAT